MRRPPAILLVLAVIGAALFVLPLIGLLGVTPWTDLGSLLTDDVVVDALSPPSSSATGIRPSTLGSIETTLPHSTAAMAPTCDAEYVLFSIQAENAAVKITFSFASRGVW